MLLLLELLLELDNNQRERKKERQRGTVPKRKKGTIVRRTRRWLLVAAAAPIRSLRLFLPPFVVFGHDFFTSCRGRHPPNTARRSPKRDSNKHTTNQAHKHTTKQPSTQSPGQEPTQTRSQVKPWESRGFGETLLIDSWYRNHDHWNCGNRSKYRRVIACDRKSKMHPYCHGFILGVISELYYCL